MKTPEGDPVTKAEKIMSRCVALRFEGKKKVTALTKLRGGMVGGGAAPDAEERIVINAVAEDGRGQNFRLLANGP